MSQPGDHFEQEADRVADAIARDGTARLSPGQSDTLFQRQTGDKKPDDPEHKAYKDAAAAASKAFEHSESAKALKVQAEKLGKDFLSTVDGKVLTGTAIVNLVTTLAASDSPLPVQLPEIPLDFIASGLKGKLVYEGPVRHPTKAALTLVYALPAVKGLTVSTGYEGVPSAEGKADQQAVYTPALTPSKTTAGLSYAPPALPGLKGTIGVEGGPFAPSKASVGLSYSPKSVPGLSVKAGVEGSPLVPTKAGISLEYVTPEPKRRRGTGGRERFAAETAKIAEEQTKVREALKSPQERALEQQFWDAYWKEQLRVPGVEIKPREEEPVLQREAIPKAQAVPCVAPPVVHDVVASSGQPLDRETRRFMEPRFGHDFSHVRVHTDARAADSARAVDARAYTVGREIGFGSGQFAPSSPEGRRLLAHELAHVVQQNGAAKLAPDSVAASSSSIILARQKGAKTKDSKLVQDFAKQFPAAADLIRRSPDALKLIVEAEKAGATFGGYVEESEGKDLGRAHTSVQTVFVPKATPDGAPAMGEFLFELNNALHYPRVVKLDTEAKRGAKGKLSADEYAYKMMALEIDGVLRTGEIWFKSRDSLCKKLDCKKYDPYFWLDRYQAYRKGDKKKDDLIKEALDHPYGASAVAKNPREFFKKRYEALGRMK